MSGVMADLPVGSIVAGRFRVEAVLGSGGYGSVYAATQLNLGRVVALKLLHPHVLLRGNARARFEREARLAQQLSHPNCVRLFDFGSMEDGRAFIVWEHLRGSSLDAVIARGPLPLDRVVRIASQVLKALAEAHALGIVHRDVKPGNVFLSDFVGEPDFVKVLDFGIATSTKEDAPSLTQAGAALGTASYMSPEQVRGEAVDGRSDLYSLGLVMSEMVAGQAVFVGQSSLEVAMKQIAPEVVPHSAAVRCSPLHAVIARATEKDRDRRFPSAEAMLAALGSPAELTFQDRVPRFVGTGAAAARVFDSTALPAELITPELAAGLASGPSTQRMPTTGGAAPTHTASPHVETVASQRVGGSPSPSRVPLLALGAALLLGAAALGVAALWRPPPAEGVAEDESVQRKRRASTSEDGELDDADVEKLAYDFVAAALKNPRKPCRPIDSDLGSWHVHGVRLEELIQRAERAGYRCRRHVALGASGVYEFEQDGSPRTLFMYYQGLINTMSASPGSRTITDEASRHSLTVVSSDASVKAASAFADALSE